MVEHQRPALYYQVVLSAMVATLFALARLHVLHPPLHLHQHYHLIRILPSKSLLFQPVLKNLVRWPSKNITMKRVPTMFMCVF